MSLNIEELEAQLREANIDKAIYTEGIKVKLPFGDEGIIDHTCRTGFDFFPYKVKITHSPYGFNVVGDVVGFKNTQLNLFE